MIYVVTPVHNRREITRAFLRCMKRQRYTETEVVIVDDGSTDGTSRMIREEFPDATLLTGDGDLWWSGGTNVGLEYVLGKAGDDDYVLIINDDLEVEPDYLKNLESFARRHPRAIVGSVVVTFDNPDVIWDGGRTTNWITAKRRVLHQGSSLSEFPDATYLKVSELTGRGMLAPVSAFREIGLYDARSFKHRGDTEWPVRASRHGYDLLVYYGARVKTHPDLTHLSEKRPYRLRDFRAYFFDFRSSGWWNFHYHFARKTARSPIQFLSFLTFDLARISVSFFRNCRSI
jgi:GT2 family glycosyltransferase